MYIVLRLVDKGTLLNPVKNYELSFPVADALNEFGYGEHAVVNTAGKIVGKLFLNPNQ